MQIFYLLVEDDEDGYVYDDVDYHDVDDDDAKHNNDDI